MNEILKSQMNVKTTTKTWRYKSSIPFNTELSICDNEALCS